MRLVITVLAWKAEHVGVVMVTGASGGIGAAIVTALAEAGHRVITIGRDRSRLPPESGARHIAADLAAPQRLAEVIAEPAHRTTI